MYNVKEKIEKMLRETGYRNARIMKVDMNVFYKKDKAILLIDNRNNCIRSKAEVKQLVKEVNYIPEIMCSGEKSVLTIIISHNSIGERKYAVSNTVVIDVRRNYFSSNSLQREFSGELSMIKSVADIEILKHERFSSMVNDLNSHRMIATPLILLLNIVLFYYMRNGHTAEAYGLSIDSVLNNKGSICYITYMFLHANVLHLLMNSLSLFFFGKAVERKHGTIKMFTVYLVGGIIAGYASLISKAISGVDAPTVGASGAIYALLGAMLISSLYNSSYNKKQLFITVAVNLAYIGADLLNPRIDAWAHIGGYFSGMIIMTNMLLLEKVIFLLKYNKTTGLLYGKERMTVIS